MYCKVMNTRLKGQKGEDIACKFLENHGFLIIERNYQKKWGEIDIIAIKDKITHFFEVKSVVGDYSKSNDVHRPEDNVHGLKVRNISRTIETYFAEKRMSSESEFNFHVICVYMNEQTRRARVKWIENVILC